MRGSCQCRTCRHRRLVCDGVDPQARLRLVGDAVGPAGSRVGGRSSGGLVSRAHCLGPRRDRVRHRRRCCTMLRRNGDAVAVAERRGGGACCACSRVATSSKLPRAFAIGARAAFPLPHRACRLVLSRSLQSEDEGDGTNGCPASAGAIARAPWDGGRECSSRAGSAVNASHATMPHSCHTSRMFENLRTRSSLGRMLTYRNVSIKCRAQPYNARCCCALRPCRERKAVSRTYHVSCGAENGVVDWPPNHLQARRCRSL